eukprot:10160297-Heterocapsa_arctica.AAC.1
MQGGPTQQTDQASRNSAAVITWGSGARGLCNTGGQRSARPWAIPVGSPGTLRQADAVSNSLPCRRRRRPDTADTGRAPCLALPRAHGRRPHTRHHRGACGAWRSR